MIPKFRAWDKEGNRMILPKYLYSIDLLKEQVTERTKCNYTFGLHSIPFDKVEFMQSTGLFDRNGQEIFEGDVLKFNDEWAEYCHEGYVDGSVEGINFVEVVRGEACFEFGKTRYPESSLFIRMEDERLTFAELIKSRDFEFEIIGNIYENPDLLEVE